MTVLDLPTVPSVPLQSGLKSVDELSKQIVAFAGRLSAATCQWLLLVAEFDARSGFERSCLGSTARWLSHTCGVSHRTAVEHVRVARALASQPPLIEAMSAGRLSYSHVRAITRVLGPNDHQLTVELIMTAEHGTVGQLESTVRGLQEVATVEKGAKADPVEYLKHEWATDGRWRMSTRLDPEGGALIETVLARVATDAEPNTQLTATEALLRMAEITLAALNDRGSGVIRDLRTDERATVVIHVDADRVPVAVSPAQPRSRERGSEYQATGDAGPNGDRAPVPARRPFGRIADGPGLSDAVLRRLMCAGRIRTIVERADPDGRRTPLDLGRAHRVVSSRLFRALMLRDRGCRHPGCANTKWLHAHHIRHWIDGGQTNVDNLVLLCSQHHKAHHDGAVSISTAENGQLEFRTADGTLLNTHPTDAQTPSRTELLDAERTHVDDDAAHTRWDGSRLDRHYAVAVLAHARSA